MKKDTLYQKSNYDFDERDIHKVTFEEFLTYSRGKKREYFCHMSSYYGYSLEDFAKEFQTNVGTIKVWSQRVGYYPNNHVSSRMKKSRDNLIFERTISVFGPAMPARKLCYE